MSTLCLKVAKDPCATGEEVVSNLRSLITLSHPHKVTDWPCRMFKKCSLIGMTNMFVRGILLGYDFDKGVTICRHCLAQLKNVNTTWRTQNDVASIVVYKVKKDQPPCKQVTNLQYKQ